MDTLTSIRVFHQVVASSSFTKSAEKLGMSVAMTSKHISHLEKILGTKLLHRNSRNLHLTEAGRGYLNESLYALELLDNAKNTAGGATDVAQGVLKITMPLWFANAKVAGWLAEFRQLYPNIILDLSLSNNMVDLVADGFDLALRLTKNMNPALIARGLGGVDFYPVASPQFLEIHGEPKTAEDFNELQAVLPTYVKMTNLTVTHKTTQTIQTLNPKSVAFSDDTLMIAELVRAGLGVGYLPSWVIEEDLRAGKLVHILPEYHAVTAPLFATYVDRTFLTAKVRCFIDFLAQKCNE